MSLAELKEAIGTSGAAVVAGIAGARLAHQAADVFVDPAQYWPSKDEPPVALFGYEQWLERQRAAKVSVLLTDTARIGSADRPALRKALRRWQSVRQPVLVVLPIVPWWLKDGLACLIEEVKAAGRPVAVVVLHHFNGLDAAGAVSGLVTFIAAVYPIPVVPLRFDVSAIGAVAYGASAGFVGLSTTTRHGPLPLPIRKDESDSDREPDTSPSVFVPALHDYFKASKLPAIARAGEPAVLRCHDPVCAGDSLLRVTRLAEMGKLPTARQLATRHNMASLEQLARVVFSSPEPKDAWWEHCMSGANVAASLIESGVSISRSSWLRQWLGLGSPSHEPVTLH